MSQNEIRTCVATKQKLPKKKMLRLFIHNNQLCFDEAGVGVGRGVYLAKNIKALNKKKIFIKGKSYIIDNELKAVLTEIISGSYHE